jgi:hypothetical protein
MEKRSLLPGKRVTAYASGEQNNDAVRSLYMSVGDVVYLNPLRASEGGELRLFPSNELFVPSERFGMYVIGDDNDE